MYFLLGALEKHVYIEGVIEALTYSIQILDLDPVGSARDWVVRGAILKPLWGDGETDAYIHWKSWGSAVGFRSRTH
jgi:hypothetical protein